MEEHLFKIKSLVGEDKNYFFKTVAKQNEEISKIVGIIFRKVRGKT